MMALLCTCAVAQRSPIISILPSLSGHAVTSSIAVHLSLIRVAASPGVFEAPCYAASLHPLILDEVAHPDRSIYCLVCVSSMASAGGVHLRRRRYVD
ncbi:hypothetical protein OBBRIDRAFT_153670 [Obba rivulosa]|uniref:Uncharacterized protein n=1 Tax=Obba rivulosa TaxID=1052685 RepID=A0A8E2AMN8_9APHY|nr:hypothetical protein OBBRIDRAFT_153670 [Obba rivulosa]